MTAQTLELLVGGTVESLDEWSETATAGWPVAAGFGRGHRSVGVDSATGASVAASAGSPPNSGHQR